MKDDDTTIQDGQHELFVYKVHCVSVDKQFIIAWSYPQYKETARGAYKYSSLPCINEPNMPQIVNSDLLCPRDNFIIKTRICSTKLTQNGMHHRA